MKRDMMEAFSWSALVTSLALWMLSGRHSWKKVASADLPSTTRGRKRTVAVKFIEVLNVKCSDPIAIFTTGEWNGY